MTFVPIPHVQDDHLIETLWGNTVADDIAYLKGRTDIKPYMLRYPGSAFNIANGTNQAALSATTPALPNGALVTVIATAVLGLPAAGGAYDVNYSVGGVSAIDGNPTGKQLYASTTMRSLVATGATLAVIITVNNWGSQVCNVKAETGISVLVFPV